MRRLIHKHTVLFLTVLFVGTGIALADDVLVLGDINGNGSVTADDATALVTYLHNGGTINNDVADVNRDGVIDIADVTAIRNIISSGTYDKGTASTLFFLTTTVSKTYGDAAFTNTLVRSGSTGAITYASSNTDVATVDATSGEVTVKGAGSATITATLTDKDGINGTTASYSLTVSKATPAVTAPTGKTGLTFSGVAQQLIDDAGSTTGGTLLYRLGTDGTWTSDATAIKATDAGYYIVYYQVTGDGNYNAVDATAIDAVSIGKLAATIVFPDGNQTKTYGDAAFTKTVTNTGDGSVTYASSNTGVATVGETSGEVTIAGQGEATITATVTPTANSTYATTTATYTVTVSKKEVTVTGITASNKAYDGNTDATLVYSGVTITGKVGSDDVTATATGTFADANAGTGKTVNITGITLSGTKAGNYTLATTGNQPSTTADITKVATTITTAPTAKTGLTYTGTVQDLVAAGTPTGGTLYYLVADTKPVTTEGTWSTNIPTGTDAKTYKVWYYVKADDNHTDSEVYNAVDVTITAAPASVTNAPAFVADVLTYTGAAQSLITAGTATGGTLKYFASTTNTKPSTNDSGWTSDIPTGNGAGTYYVWYYIDADGNYTSTTITAIEGNSKEISKADGSVTLSESTISFGASDAVNSTKTFTVTNNTSGGTLSVQSSNGSAVTASIEGTTVTLTRQSAAAASVIITVTSASTTNYNEASQTCTVSLTEVDPFAGLTDSDRGKVIGDDGKIYANATAANEAGATAVAMIAYVGSETGDAEHTHGLAMALDESATEVAWSSDATTDLTGLTNVFNGGNSHGELGKAFADMSGISNTNTIIENSTTSAAKSAKDKTQVTGCSQWFLPSSGQWIKVLNAYEAGITETSNSGNLGTVSAENQTVNNTFKTALESAGGTAIDLWGEYWTSTEYDNDRVIKVNVSQWGVVVSTQNKEFTKNTYYTTKVRPFLAF